MIRGIVLRKRPIMLWITSRSRSSMVSNIFIKHGVWWGNTNAQISGYEMYENQNIKALLHEFKQRYWKKVHLTPVSDEWNKEFVKRLDEITPLDRSWMMKTGVEYFNAFKDLNPYNIFIRRAPEGVAHSLSSKRKDVRYEDAFHAAQWRFTYMDSLREEFGGVDVDTDKVINGDFTDIEKAIEYCGLEYDEQATMEAIRIK